MCVSAARRSCRFVIITIGSGQWRRANTLVDAGGEGGDQVDTACVQRGSTTCSDVARCSVASLLLTRMYIYYYCFWLF